MRAVNTLLLLAAFTLPVGCEVQISATSRSAAKPTPEDVPAKKVEGKSPSPSTPGKPVLSVRAEDLALDYGDENELVPAAKYGGKRIELTGDVVRVSKSARGAVVAYSTLGSGEANIFCTMRAGQDDALAGIKPGESEKKTTVHGVCRGRRKASVWPGWALELDDCVLVADR
jgi:hypothetical protein